VRNANTPEVEASLNRLVETPISIAMARLLATHGVREEALEWSLFRAVSLLLMLQPVRACRHAERLEETVTRTDAELDELARAAGALYRIGRITVNEHLALLYPAAGFFPLVGRQEDRSYGLAIGLPVGRRHAFIAVPRSMDWEASTAQWSAKAGALVASASVGTSARVVIPPSERGGPERVHTLVHTLRGDLDELLRSCRQHNEALDDLNASLALL
jgi:hypothetical protein